MRIAIDCRSITGPGGEMAGIGHYTYFLVRHLLRLDGADEYTLFVEHALPASTITDLKGSARNVRIKRMPSKKGLPYFGSHRTFSKAVEKEKPDIFHGPTGSLPLGYRGKSVVTVHDLAIYLHPEWFPGRQFFSKRVVVPAGLERAERIISVSRSTKRDIMKLFSIPSEKIAVIHEGVEFHVPEGELSGTRSLQDRYGIDRPYFMALGTIEPRKNYPRIIEAYVALAKGFPELVGQTELLIAGGEGWKTDATMKALAKGEKALKESPARIRTLGYVPAEDKWGLLAESVAFLFPSLYEGFGLPVLEAMSLGVPVVVSETSSLPEITGSDGAMLVDPNDTTEWVLAMKALLENPMKRAELGRLGMERSTEFGWQKTAGETLEVYEAAVMGGEVARQATNLRKRWIDETLFHTPHRPL